MIMRAYAVYDKAVLAYAPPLFFRTEGEALRTFSDACVQEGTQFNKHSADYAFFHVGYFDDNSGVFGLLPSGPDLVLTGVQARSYIEGEAVDRTSPA